jgi:hypothetical protein
MPAGVILIGCLVATILTIVIVPHRDAAAHRIDMQSIQRP